MITEVHVPSRSTGLAIGLRCGAAPLGLSNAFLRSRIRNAIRHLKMSEQFLNKKEIHYYFVEIRRQTTRVISESQKFAAHIKPVRAHWAPQCVLQCDSRCVLGWVPVSVPEWLSVISSKFQRPRKKQRLSDRFELLPKNRFNKQNDFAEEF